MLSRSALRPLTLASFRSVATNAAKGALKIKGQGHLCKTQLGTPPEEWVKGPIGVGIITYLCSGDFCALRHEQSGLTFGIMEDGYSTGLTIGVITAFALIKLVPVIAKWTDGEIKKIESGIKGSSMKKLKVMSISSSKEMQTLTRQNLDRSSLREKSY
ncbi:ATP synthase subunit b, mitochondrial [Drosophila ficusphila]|uniref:ATP synthase subunit b, mitochondrial n=1 Tax=Drosophila ficusphila TaxID=30025 RepID=UPI0007E7D040|nr:ATP synthase subunit b, mitochondrial [Drosophila ficusphila]